MTQVVRVGESDAFHNRLTHTIKVAQLGRRLAQHFLRRDPALARELGIEPEVVEASCLAHDLGHPPFGHLGEETLNQLLRDAGETDGFEGNAQSFRIVTKLSVRLDSDGLNLTRATLAAILKYPWVFDRDDASRNKKWGAYRSERDDFEFARYGLGGTVKTAEAELMDWADDIAYSVHDVEDFTRVRLIPWSSVEKHADDIVQQALKSWYGAPSDAKKRLEGALQAVLALIPPTMREPYEGRRDQRQKLRMWTSTMIGHFFRETHLQRPRATNERCFHIGRDIYAQMLVLKQLTRGFVLRSPALHAQQHGQRRIIREVFEDLVADLSGGTRYFPIKHRHLISTTSTDARAAGDCIASLTEGELVALHGRLRGRDGGSVYDPIVL